MAGVSEERFRAKVDLRADHDVWTGATDGSGTGLVRIDGRLRTVQRAAWEFAHGPLAAGERVQACAQNKACVRLSHLRLAMPAGDRTRRRRGSGSLREVKPGVWRLVVSDGPGQGGQARRRFRTVRGTRQDADEALQLFSETTTHPTRLGDLRVRELLDRYVDWLDEADAVPARRIADTLVEPHIGREFAVLLDPGGVEELLRRLHATGLARAELHGALYLLKGAYRWARSQRWTSVDPTTDVVLRDIVG